MPFLQAHTLISSTEVLLLALLDALFIGMARGGLHLMRSVEARRILFQVVA